MGDSGLFPEDGELYDSYSARSSRSRSRSRSRGYRRRHHKSHRSRKSRRHSSRRHRHRRYRSRSRSVSRSYTRSRSRSHSRRRRSRSPRRSPSYTRSPMKRRRYFGTRENPHRSNCLGIFGLNTSTSEGQLTELFSKYGKLDKVTIVYDAKTMMSRGFGFIYFQNVQDAEYARSECNGMTIDEKRIRVDFSITKRAHTPTPGIYMGNYVNSGYPERMASREAHSSRKSASYRRTRSGSLPRSRSRSRH